MFGFIVGVALTIGFVSFARHGGVMWSRRRFPGHMGRHGGSRRGSWMLSRLFRRLDTSPEQEEVITDAWTSARRTIRSQRSGMGEWREAMARVMAADGLDDKELREVLDAQDGRLGTVKGAVAEAVSRVHSVLDPMQRQELAELIAEGFGRRRRVGRGYA